MAKKAAKKTVKKRATEKDLKHLFGVGLCGNLQSFEDQLGVLNHPPSVYEEVIHPLHYNGLPNGVECWDVVEHFPTNVGSAIKYLWRAGQKPGQTTVKDLKKALQWTQRQIDLLEGKNPNMGIR
jgi:hypothetical protein